MKPTETIVGLRSRVVGALEASGIVLRDDQVTLLLRHAELVLEANRRVNLTRIVDAEGIAVRHIVDSLLPLRYIGTLDDPFVDIGSGAGYPGVPLAIASGFPGILCESVGKKAMFLKDCVADLRLGVEVYAGRAEDLAAERPAIAGTVVARAVSSLGALVELASPLLRDGGRLIALKARPTVDEVENAKQTCAMCGMMQQAVHEYALPFTDEPRTVFAYIRSGSPAVRLPRRPGLAQKHPLVG